MGAVRDDLTFTAYALRLGYEVLGHGAFPLGTANFVAGIPQDSVQFVKGNVHVWLTSRGWRVGLLKDGLFVRAQEDDFHRRLPAALEAGVKVAAEHAPAVVAGRAT